MKKGIIASKGYAIGNVVLKAASEDNFIKRDNIDIEVEKELLRKALQASEEQLVMLRDKTQKEMGETEASVFDSHLMFLVDPEFTGAAFKYIEEKRVSADFAMQEIANAYLDIFSTIEDEYMRERAADVRDVSERIIKNIKGNKDNSLTDIPQNSIVVVHDLTPSDTAGLDKSRVVAFLTDIGGKTSHSAIMARTLEIPAIVGMENITSSVKAGDLLIVDGVTGEVIFDPDPETIQIYKVRMKKFQEEKDRLKSLVNTKTLTKEGKAIIVAGNIGSPEDVKRVIENGGEGVGLFRTEFLYMDRETIPNEDEQFSSYKYVLEKMGERPVVIRTLDIGGDKKLQYLPMPEEMNPFLGYRAIRLCLDRKDIFSIQLRALLRASAFGNLQIMFPMISSLEEFLEAKQLIKECMEELKSEGIKFNEDIKLGIMVEIPAAAIIADELAKHVDFFSIGTNDLIQYTLAVDRMNEKVAYLYNPMHPAVLKLIKMTIDAAHKEGIWCGMCGEMAGDENAIGILLDYGLDEFSMSASSILRAKEIIMGL